MLAVGDQAPDFVLTAVDGRPVRLSDLLNDVSILVVFVAEECPTSRMMLKRLGALAAELEAARVRVVTVHQDPPEVAERTMRRSRAGFLALAEPPPYETASAYGIATVPASFLVGADRNILAAFEGWSAEDLERALGIGANASGGAAPEITREPPIVKPGCASKNALDPGLVAGEADAFDLLEDLFERGWTDGLPVIPPTRERVDRMLAGADPKQSLGLVPPGMGELTLERLAACAVLAGCHPSYFPLVRTAAEAMLDPAFNVHGLTNTTHTCGVVVIVNGPVRRRIGMNAGMNCMGGWNRANATIGRALRLVIGLTGQGLPGKLDRSTLGQPGKISFCFAENEEESPWESLAVSRGFSHEQSVVTLYCGDAPFTVSDHYSRDPQDVIDSIAMAGAAVFSPNLLPMAAETVFVISPEHARMLSGAGWSKREVAERIFEAAKRRVGELRRGERSPLIAALDDDAEVSKWLSPDEVVIVVAGGHAGRFSAVLPPWVGFGLGSRIVSRALDARDD